MEEGIAYQAGGTLPASSPVYVTREADRELLELCRQGEFCYVLSTRQVGKSSLMARTRHALVKEGFGTVAIDLTAIGSDVESKWYYGIAEEIVRQLRLPVDFDSFWRQVENLPYAQRLLRLTEDIVLPGFPGRIVIFVDEIDSTLSLGYTDDFFAAIRAMFNARALNEEFRRVGFVLLGVASPTDLNLKRELAQGFTRPADQSQKL